VPSKFSSTGERVLSGRFAYSQRAFKKNKCIFLLKKKKENYFWQEMLQSIILRDGDFGLKF